MPQKNIVNQPNWKWSHVFTRLILNNRSNLVNQKTANEESGEHDSGGVIFLPDLDMDVVQGHVVLSSKHCRWGNIRNN